MLIVHCSSTRVTSRFCIDKIKRAIAAPMDQPIEDGLEERAPVAFDSSDSDYEAEEPSYPSPRAHNTR